VIGNVSHFDIRDQIRDGLLGDGDLGGGFGVGCFHVSENDDFFCAVNFFFKFFFGAWNILRVVEHFIWK